MNKVMCKNDAVTRYVKIKICYFYILQFFNTYIKLYIGTQLLYLKNKNVTFKFFLSFYF